VAEPEKKKRVRVSAAWREAKALVAAHKKRLGLGLALVLVNSAVGFVVPALPKFLVDDVIAKKDLALLDKLVLLAAGATLVQAITGYALSQILGVAAQRAINDMRKALQSHVARLPVRYFDSTQTGVLVSRIMTDAEGIRNLVGTGLVEFTGGLIKSVLGLTVLFFVNWKLTLAIVCVLALFGGLMAWFFRVLRPLFRERGKIIGEISGRLTQMLGGVRVVKAYVAEPQEERVFATGVERLFANVKKSMTGVSMSFSITIALVGIVSAVFAWMGGRAVIAGEMTTGDLFMYMAFVAFIVGPIVQIASIGTQITEAFGGLDRIREIRGVATEDEGDADRAPTPDLRGDFAFEDVSFEYFEGKLVLEHITFRAPAGTTTALVGSSGSGKSTLVSLVMAFNRPKSGRITVDGRDLAGLRLRDYRSHLGYVMQDNFLFDGTIAENVAFSRPDAARAEIEDACRLAHCDEFTKGFEKGLDTVVGERGVKLSGGQRQRVAIARALLAKPRVLILDEATSSLDSESEAMIQDGLATLRKSRTTFVIAHRLSTIRSADQILVIEAGRIVERGTHADLLALGGRYKQLHDRQYAFEAERFVNPGEELAGLSTSVPRS
jgi:subfamily B ATP-binding cassette protein MsbA